MSVHIRQLECFAGAQTATFGYVLALCVKAVLGFRAERNQQRVSFPKCSLCLCDLQGLRMSRDCSLLVRLRQPRFYQGNFVRLYEAPTCVPFVVCVVAT